MNDLSHSIKTQRIEDKELIRRFTEADSEVAFRLLMQRYLVYVHSLCRRDLRDVTLAEDATQVVFMLLARKARTLRNVESLGGWLFRVTRLVCRNLHRQQMRTRRHEVALSADISPAVQVELSAVEHPLVLKALDALCQKDLQVILLRFFEEQEFAQIGNRLGISEDAARMRVNRALSKMRSYLASHGIHQDLEEGIAILLVPTGSNVPVSPQCQTAITEMARTIALGNALYRLPIDNPLRPTFEGVIRIMRLHTVRPIAITAVALAILCSPFLISGRLRAAVAPLPVKTVPTSSLPAEPIKPNPVVVMSFRMIEQIIDQDGKPQDRTLSAPTIMARDNQQAGITLSAPSAMGEQKWVTEAVPHLYEDGSIGLKVTLHNQETTSSGNSNGEIEQEETVKEQTVSSNLRMKPGKPVRISLIKGPRSEFLLEVTARKQ